MLGVESSPPPPKPLSFPLPLPPEGLITIRARPIRKVLVDLRHHAIRRRRALDRILLLRIRVEAPVLLHHEVVASHEAHGHGDRIRVRGLGGRFGSGTGGAEEEAQGVPAWGEAHPEEGDLEDAVAPGARRGGHGGGGDGGGAPLEEDERRGGCGGADAAPEADEVLPAI